MEIILHYTTRDRNLMGLQSDLLGAHALGLRNILCLTGDPPSLGDYPNMTAVYDTDSVGLIGIVGKMNQRHGRGGHVDRRRARTSRSAARSTRPPRTSTTSSSTSARSSTPARSS